MKKRNLLVLATVLFLGLGTSCSSSNYQYQSKASIKIVSTKEGKVYAPDEVEIVETYHSIEDKRFYNTQVLPSVGDVNILVLPLLIPGYETIDINNDEQDDKEEVLNDIKKTFFDEGSTKELGFESVKSFYQKSSYDQLHLNGVVTDWFDVTLGSYDFDLSSAIDIDGNARTQQVVQAAIDWAESNQHINLSDYDNDKDGYIDGVWCIYSCPNYQNGGPRPQNDAGNYWAYTQWGNQNTFGSENEPIFNLYGWASYDFMYEGYGKDTLDAHTFIHETGHFLGLSDYYSDSMTYNPVGKVDMMDGNMIDHNSYSKMLLGWTKPYIVTGSAELDLYSMENKDCFIVIPGDSYDDGEKFDPFSEYILIELYSNEGLNEKDSKTQLPDRPLAMNAKGVRIYHIDNRKFVLNGETIEEYENQTINNQNRFVLPITNQLNPNVYNYYFDFDVDYNLFDEIRLIEANNVDTFRQGGKQSAKTLFKNGDSFTLDKYKNFFFNGEENKISFNNLDTWSYEVQIGEIS